MQMELSQVNYCDFVLWREGEIFHQRILLDKDFIDETFQRAETFVKMAILPELIDKWFSKQNAMQTCTDQLQDSTPTDTSSQG